MLWLCIHLPLLPLEALACLPEWPAAVVESRGARRHLVRVSAAAAQRGVFPGLPAPAALSLVPELRLLDRRFEAERAALESVACWAYRFGAPVTLCPALSCVFVEVRHSLRLFGGWRLFRAQVEREALDLHYRTAFGVAPTMAAAALLAHAGLGLDRPVGQLHQLPLALRDVSLTQLPFDEQVRDVLYGAGLRTVGQVLGLPREALARRFGPEVAQWLDQLVGQAPEAWEAFEPPAQYRRRFELAGLVTSSQALLFPLRAMIGDFSQYLRARDVAVQQLRIVFVDGLRQRTAMEIGLLAPTRDPVRLLLVLRERLERSCPVPTTRIRERSPPLPQAGEGSGPAASGCRMEPLSLAEGVQELFLEAERFEAASIVQDDLFGSGRRQEDRDTLMERLRARLGPEAIRQVAVTGDHRPEKAWKTGQAGSACADTRYPPRPLWLLPAARRIEAPARLLGPAERIESGWWEGPDQCRDYFTAEDAEGRRLWVYREPDGARWWLHGLWQ